MISCTLSIDEKTYQKLLNYINDGKLSGEETLVKIMNTLGITLADFTDIFPDIK